MTVDSVRVMTMNVWARHGDWRARRAVLRSGLRALQPDLVALQETVVTDGYDQVADLLVTERVDPRESAGSLLVASVDAPDSFDRVSFASPKPSFRLGLERGRELWAVLAAGRLEDVMGDRGGHLVLAGDFDAVPRSASMRFWTGMQSLKATSVAYRDAWETVHGDDAGHTFSPPNPLVTSGNWPSAEVERPPGYSPQPMGNTSKGAACATPSRWPVTRDMPSRNSPASKSFQPRPSM